MRTLVLRYPIRMQTII